MMSFSVVNGRGRPSDRSKEEGLIKIRERRVVVGGLAQGRQVGYLIIDGIERGRIFAIDDTHRRVNPGPNLLL